METPDPIPNSAVKHEDANGTAGATPWESQSPPGLRGCGAVGSAFEWHSKGRRFDPGQLHLNPISDSIKQCLNNQRKPRMKNSLAVFFMHGFTLALIEIA